MARWIYNRPYDCCDESELALAKQLAILPDDWLIRWGFYYHRDHEGDFLILGPTGGVLVLEVKGGSFRQFALTGRWDGPQKDHPFFQLSAEWDGVIQRLRKVACGRTLPFVHKALALPEVLLEPGATQFCGIDREFILDHSNLADFAVAWERLFQRRKVTAEARQVFVEAYAAESQPSAIRHFIGETDRILLRHATAEFELLDMLRENRQILVQGGPGTGKTWLAFEQAYRLAEREPGQEVLLLCYNLALARTLAGMTAKRVPKRGRITVRSWEGLARELYGTARLKWREPRDYEECCRFFAEEVPARLRQIVRDKKFRPCYDALVVDEAQDHDTRFADEPPESDGAGWWNVYGKLLREGNGAPLAAFYDPGQRPLFRDPNAFDVARLRRHFTQALHVKLANALRYTRPVFEFLKRLRSETTAPLVDELRHRGQLPEGPDVELYDAAPGETPSKVNEVVTNWIAGGFCRVDDILILSPHSQKSRSSLARCDQIGAWPLVEHERKQPGQLSFLSVNKAKGLDSLAVILVDLQPFDRLADAHDQMDYFMGASRARQLLAVVQVQANSG